MIGSDGGAIDEHHTLEHGRDPQPLQDIVDGAALGNVEDGLTVVTVGRKKAGEGREEPDFDRQR
jgi:hypothetical protein